MTPGDDCVCSHKMIRPAKDMTLQLGVRSGTARWIQLRTILVGNELNDRQPIKQKGSFFVASVHVTRRLTHSQATTALKDQSKK